MSSNELLTHRVDGEGEPLLLLNGGMMTWAAWGPVAASLRERFRLVLFDLRGQLLSPGRAPARIEDNVDDVVALLDALEIEKAHLLGTSYGGEIALHLAAREPERVRSLVAAAVSDVATEPLSTGAERVGALLDGELSEEDRERLWEILVADIYSREFRRIHGEALEERRAALLRLDERWFRDLGPILESVAGLDVRSAASRIRCPTLIVVADRDRVIPPERSLALAGSIPGAEVRRHPTSGHALVVEDPDWLTEVSLEFLLRHSGGDPSPEAS